MKEQTAPEVSPANIRQAALGESSLSMPNHSLYFNNDR